MDDIIDSLYPEITLETDDILMNIAVKKDYSDIKELNKRKEQFITDLKDFIDEFSQTSECEEFIAYFD